MKLISLNTYGGAVFEPLMEWVKSHAETTDVFCFQEILRAGSKDTPRKSHRARTNLYQELIEILPNHIERYGVMQEGFDCKTLTDKHVQYGLAMFTKHHIEVDASGDFFIYRHLNALIGDDYSTLGALAQWIQFNQDGTTVTAMNVHGTSEPGNKRDTPDRVKQSQEILDFLEKQPGEKIVMGDFNLYPDTESIRMFEQAGFRNLITEFDIKDTRGTMMRKLHPQYEHGEYGFQNFADFTFVTKGIEVTSFEVPDEPISDHLPMILECDVKTTSD